MFDRNVIPGYNGDDKEQEVEKATFEVIRDDEEGYIYYDGALLYDREADEEGEDDLFDALVGLGHKMAARGYVEMVEQGREDEQACV